MSKLLHILSILGLTVPNAVYLALNYQSLTQTHAIALSMVMMVVLSVIGLGTLCHFKIKPGVWMTIIGAFILALSNVSYVAGIALIIEGIALAIDSYILRPLIVSAKTRELEKHGKQVTYTRTIE